MHATEFEPLVSLASLVEGLVFGLLLSSGILSAGGLRIGLFLLAAFLFFDAVFPPEEPAYIYEFFITAVTGFLLGILFPLSILVVAPVVVAVVFLVRRIRSTVS